MYINLAVFFFVLAIQNIECGRFNISYEELDQCKEYDALSGYNYHTYFKIDDIHGGNSKNYMVNVKLFILAAKDAHILLSPTNAPMHNSSVYEIVLGAGSNTFAEIRRRRQSQPLRTIRTRKLLSSINPLPIRLLVGIDGTINVSVPGSDVLNLTAKDSTPFAVKYISFSTWGATEAKFFYDCQTKDTVEENFLDILMPQTPSDQLRSSLFSLYDYNAVPNGLTQVILEMDVLKVSYDYRNSYMSTRAIFRANWTDPKMKWNPDNYSDIHGLRIDSSNIESKMLWKPSFKLINGQGKFFKGLNIEFTLVVFSTGLVTAESKGLFFETWCTASEPKWPFNTVDCQIILGIQNISIMPILPQSRRKSIHLFESQGNEEWYTYGVFLESSSSPDVSCSYATFNVELKRNIYFYSIVLTSPLFAAVVVLMISLFSTGFRKLALNLLSVFILHVMFIFLAEHSPMEFVPKIVLFYDLIFILSLTVFVTNITWLSQVGNDNQKCLQFMNILQFRCFIPFLDGWEKNDIMYYTKITETSSARFANLLDRIVFIILVITLLLIIFSCHF